MASYVTVYSDLFRAHPIYPNIPYRPEEKCVELEGGWFDTGKKQAEAFWTEEEKNAFLKKTNKITWGTSTYREQYTDKTDRSYESTTMKGQKITDHNQLDAKKSSNNNVAIIQEEVAKKASLIQPKTDNELMKAMRGTFEKDPERFVHQPLNTHRRNTICHPDEAFYTMRTRCKPLAQPHSRQVLGYSRPANYQCGLSVYQKDISRPGYVCMRDHLLKPVVKENGHRPTNTVSPIFALPDGERLLL